MVLHVDAGGLAAASAALACHALAFVDGEAEEREAAEDAEQGAHGADGVAVGPAAVPCEEADQREGDSCRDKQGGCEAFTSGKSRDTPDHASVGAVGGQQSEQELQAQEGAGHGDQQHCGPHDAVLLLVGEALRIVLRGGQGLSGGLEPLETARLPAVHGFSPDAPQADDHVLEYAQRADDRTVEPSEQQGEQQHSQDYREVQRED